MAYKDPNFDLITYLCNLPFLRRYNKQKMQAWLWAIVLHILLFGFLVGYWYKNHQTAPKSPAPVPNKVQATTQRVTTISSNRSSNPHDRSQMLATATTTASTTSSTPASSEAFSVILPPVTFNAPTMYFFSASEDSPQPPIQTVEININQPPLPSWPLTEPKKPANPILTSRDVPQKEMATTIASSHPVKSNETSQLSNEIDDNNAAITNLIQQVKNKNQQKIDAATASETGQ